MNIHGKTVGLIDMAVFLIILSAFLGTGGIINTAFACLAAVAEFPAFIVTFLSSGGLMYLLIGVGVFLLVMKWVKRL